RRAHGRAEPALPDVLRPQRGGDRGQPGQPRADVHRRPEQAKGAEEMRAMLVVGMGALFLTSACKPRVIIVTGTTLGLKATPGDGNSRPPQVTLGYKRAEAALVPTSGAAADDHGRDAFATMAAFDFRTRWFGATELASFVGTGFAARDIQGDPKDPNSKQFERAFAAVTLGEVSQPLQDRRKALVER